MKVIFYLNRYPAFGGIENITSTLAKAFTEKLKYSVTVFSYERDDRLVALTPPGINYVYAEKYDDLGKWLFIKTVEKFNPDVIIFQDSYAEIEAPLLELKKICNFKLIVVEHNTPDCHLQEYRLRWNSHSWLSPKQVAKKILFPYIYSKIKNRIGKRHRTLIEASDYYVLLSDSYKQVLKKNWGIDDPKLRGIPNIKNDFAENTPVVPVKKDKIVLFVGRLTVQKGVKYLIDIWAKIESQISDWKLKILGDGELKQYVIDEIQRRNLSRVELVGFKTDVDNYYRQASAIFMTSIFEGFPLILAESMQFGVIPFAFDSYAAVHDIIDEDCGFIIRSFRTDSYVEQFIKFSHLDAERLSAIRTEAISKSEKFDEDVILEKWKELIER